jgi:hypothetical protein
MGTAMHDVVFEVRPSVRPRVVHVEFRWGNHLLGQTAIHLMYFDPLSKMEKLRGYVYDLDPFRGTTHFALEVDNTVVALWVIPTRFSAAFFNRERFDSVWWGGLLKYPSFPPTWLAEWCDSWR